MTESKITQIDGASLNIAEQRKQELKQLFPGAFTEMRNENGELVEAIDFERLKAELGEFSEIYDNRRERYGMDWPGKRDCLRLIQEPSYATLKPCREESVDFDTTQNLFIEGDNLEVLKLLQKAYYGKIKMIYIDPPYNTGNEFIYPDNYSESLETYLAYAGLVDDEGKKFSTNTKAEGRFHTKWLNMMYPRLYLARNLLREDGVIFISIDDNEVENLRRICDEIFGEENFVSSISWLKKVSPANDAKWFSSDHEYVLVYARNKALWRPTRLALSDRQKEIYQNPDNDHRGAWNSVTYTCNKSRSERPNLYYPIVNPHTGNEVWPKETAVWRYGKDVTEKLVSENRLWWGKNGESSVPRFKKFLSESEGVVPRSVWKYEDVGHTQMATEAFQALVPEIRFETPKPPKLIKQILRVACDVTEESCVMDFFAGSGTLAQAVQELRAESAKIKYILVQLPEKTEHEVLSSISDVAKARIKRSGEQVKKNFVNQLDLSGISDADFGFKVLKLDKSSFKKWVSPGIEISELQLLAQLDLAIDQIDPNASQETLLYELLLKAGIKMTETISTVELSGHKLFSVADGALLVHLEHTIEKTVIDAVLEQKPEQFICLDRAFHGNDQLKANAVKTFETYNQSLKSEDTPIVFRTV